MANNIDIILPTYNGSKYLRQQLDSIFIQTYQNFKVVIRDDGSTDDTLLVINNYANNYPGKIEILKSSTERLGSTMSFSKLLTASTANYIMLCDQDDVWLDNKVELTYNRMLRLEDEFPDRPILIYTDLKETNEYMEIVEESFIKHQKLYPNTCKTDVTLLALNAVAGCTTMINKISKKYILPVPATNIIHDHWMAINIAHYGIVEYLPIQTILYRQHNNNAVGANNVGFNYFFDKGLEPWKQFKIYYNLIKHLKFKISISKFIYYKIYFTLKRIY